MQTAKELIDFLKLSPHPEGGFYRETYRSELQIAEQELPDTFIGERSCSTCIYFLLTGEAFSSFHRIRQDEIWHFYLGDPVLIHMLSPEGTYSMVTISRDIRNGHFLQFVVPAGYWFAAELMRAEGFALLGCTVAPGFDFRDFELGSRENLITRFPDAQEIITRLTRI